MWPEVTTATVSQVRETQVRGTESGELKRKTPFNTHGKIHKYDNDAPFSLYFVVKVFPQ